eukprot:1402691-Pyramimonas_sp.AAC.1
MRGGPREMRYNVRASSGDSSRSVMLRLLLCIPLPRPSHSFSLPPNQARPRVPPGPPLGRKGAQWRAPARKF